MSRWNLSNTLHTVFRNLFIGSSNSPWSTLLVWFVRLFTLGLLLRTYIAPWLLTLTSKHIRIRSISLRSIKGLYFSRGRWTCRAERIGYVFGVVDGKRRWTLRIDGLKVEMHKEVEEAVLKRKKTKHRKNLTLADLHPSPLAGRLWRVITKVALKLEPWLRPWMRTYVVACMRLGMRWLPAVTQALSFELHSTVFIVAEIPGTQIVADEINLHCALDLTQVESVLDPAVTNTPMRTGSWKLYGMAEWQRKMKESFQRALDVAWGRTQGFASISFKLCDVTGTTPIRGYTGGHEGTRTFLHLPGTVELWGNFNFHPKSATIDDNSLTLGLSIEEIAVKVNLLNDILRAISRPKLRSPKFRPLSAMHSPSSPATPQSSLTSTTSNQTKPASPVLATAAKSRERSSSIFSISISPTTSFLSLDKRLLSPASSASPFFRAFTSPMKAPKPRVRKLKDFKYKSPLSIIQDLSIRISYASLSFSTPNNQTTYYKSVIKDINFALHPSTSSKDSLHAQWLGRTRKKESFDAESYALQLSSTTVILERHTRHKAVPLLIVGSISLQMVAFQWPSPWLEPSPFMKNDPNAPFLTLSLSVGGIEFMDRLDDLRELLQHQVLHSKGPRTRSNFLQGFDGLQLPSCAIQVNCGVVCGRVIFESDDDGDFNTLEMRSNGFEFGLTTNYDVHSAEDCSRLKALFSFHLNPVLVHVRSGYTSVGFVTDAEFLNDPAVLSVGPVEIGGNLTADAEETLGIYKVQDSSVSCTVHTIIDTICVELWHADSVSATVRLLSLLPLPPSDRVRFEEPKTSVLSELPSSILASVSLARFVVVVTAPDVNPHETDISRGVGIKALVSLELCALNLKHISRMEDVGRLESRMKLGLPQERAAYAIATAKTSKSDLDITVFARLSILNLIVRKVIATQYEADDPFLAGRDDLQPTDQEFIRIERIHTDASLTTSTIDETPQDVCRVSIDIPIVQGNFQLSNLYSSLLSVQTLHNLSKVRPSSKVRENVHESYMKWSVQCRLNAFQLLCMLPNQTVVLRLENAVFDCTTGEAIHTHLRSLVFWVPPPLFVGRWEHDMEQKWDELLTLYEWDIALPIVNSHSVSVSAKGESLRLRIPNGYILADLILDAAVVAKAGKHLIHIVKFGTFTDLPAPEAEGPKLTPNMIIEIGLLCIEALDDPFEARLGAIWKVGLEAVKHRLEREDAFIAKVAAINAVENNSDPDAVAKDDHDYHFTSKHTVSIEDARRRLHEVHFLDWRIRLQHLKAAWLHREKLLLHKLYGQQGVSGHHPFPGSKTSGHIPPLFRLTMASLKLAVSLPSFPLDTLPEFLFEQGKGLPKDTEFSLLIPLHLNFTLDSVRLIARDLPIPLIHVQGQAQDKLPAWSFDSDIVIAEEMGSSLSTDWMECPIIMADKELQGTVPLTLHVPKTIMPVKSYARPNINISTTCPTILSWGVSYGPVIQDIVRIIETMTPNPRDPSPAVGFWDKLRLIAHWTIKFTFKGEVRCYLKGSRNPAHLADHGAGFVLVWSGAPKLLIGYPNDQKQLLELTSDVMLIAIPRFGVPASDGVLNLTQPSGSPYRKVCAELHSGVRYGIGFAFERTCHHTSCINCSGNIYQRQCRIFDFIPHYDVRLGTKPAQFLIDKVEDSYDGFRSDFIHFSFSLSASTKTSRTAKSALHLTPRAFAHFWSWCALFGDVPNLRLRVGTYFAPRSISPKFGRHIATIKYHINLTKLFIMHAYIDNAKESWTDGMTPWIGVKGFIDELRVDMHQRDQETKVQGVGHGTTKVTRKKPFYAAEAIIKGLDLRAMLAIFKEPLKAQVPLTSHPSTGSYCKYDHLPQTSMSSPWYNHHDFVELEWSAPGEPSLYFLSLATCPHFAYVKRNAATIGRKTSNKFGIEDTHVCLLGHEPTAPQIQTALVAKRIEELKSEAETSSQSQSKMRMIALLQDYTNFLKDVEADPHFKHHHSHIYHMPSEVVHPEEWAEFDHVYQIHCPVVSLNKDTRDIMIQYYHCSRNRKGFEYHLATRAVKFIRDQAKPTDSPTNDTKDFRRGSNTTAQLAASAIRKILRGDNGKTSVEIDQQENLGLQTDPLDGWSSGVTLSKAHCCFLLKPQVVLKGEGPTDVCVVAAVQAKMQSFAIMDNTNIDDPISGKIMSRNYTSLSGLQTFSPVNQVPENRLKVPLEVLVDFRCESDEFERLVPQTDASFHYDKFNRLRLQSQVRSGPTIRASVDKNSAGAHNHLQDQTDLIRVHIPQFTVSASDTQFETISNVVTKLLLFSDATHKARLDKLQTLLFTYDFTDLSEAADVVSHLQGRLRESLETERILEYDHRNQYGDEGVIIAKLRLQAHIIYLVEELNFLFDAIKLAQDRTDDHMDQKSALLLHASSSELSWKMLDKDKGLLAKLVVQHSNFYWLSRQDSALVNDLAIGNLQAFDGSREAIWTEIFSKHDEPTNHPLHKRDLFLLAHWIILPPVGGISIYETFEVNLHPLKVQIDAKVGQRIMEYLWPYRRHRQQSIEEGNTSASHPVLLPDIPPHSPIRTSLDSPRALHNLRPESDSKHEGLAPPLRKLGASRSFTDLRSTRHGENSRSPFNLVGRSNSPDFVGTIRPRQRNNSGVTVEDAGDAAVMKTRSSQKTFIYVKISSMNLLLSIVKEGSFECHDVRIKTRDLVYKNQTSSFEELVNQFIPSNMSWKGWMKMVFHQPLIPVFPVAKELLSKTKLVGHSKATQDGEILEGSHSGSPKRHIFPFHVGNKNKSLQSRFSRKSTGQKHDAPIIAHQLSSEPKPIEPGELDFSHPQIIIQQAEGESDE